MRMAAAATPVASVGARAAAPLSSRLLLSALRQRAVEVESGGDDDNDEAPSDGPRTSGALGGGRVSVNLDHDSDQADGDNSNDDIEVDGSGPGAERKGEGALRDWTDARTSDGVPKLGL